MRFAFASASLAADRPRGIDLPDFRSGADIHIADRTWMGDVGGDAELVKATRSANGLAAGAAGLGSGGGVCRTRKWNAYPFRCASPAGDERDLPLLRKPHAGVMHAGAAGLGWPSA